MTKIYIEIGNNLKEVIIELIKSHHGRQVTPSFAIKEAFNLDLTSIILTEVKQDNKLKVIMINEVTSQNLPT